MQLKTLLIVVALLNLFHSNFALGIINGKRVSREDIDSRFVVSWSYQGNHFCSGVVITSYHILTAAHCVFGGLDEISFGSEIDSRSYSIPVTKAFIHPGFQNDYMNSPYPPKAVNDLAILKLSARVPTNMIRSLLLDIRSLIPDETYYISGYGKNHPESKMGVLRKSESTIKELLSFSGEFVIDGEGKPCGGDSGGPLYYLTDDLRPVVVGLTSRSDKRVNFENCEAPGIYTDLRSYLGWMRSVIRR